MTKKSGIYYGWFLCFASMLMLAGETGIFINCASQFLKPVTAALSISRAQFSLFVSIVAFASMAMCPFIGKLYNKVNPHIVTVTGGVLAGCAWMALSFAPDIKVFYILALVIGGGSVLAGSVASTILMNNWFHVSKGAAIGIASTGSGIGSMVFNPLTSKLILAFGYQAAYRYLGLIAIVLLIPIAILYRYRPEDMGLKPLGDNSGSTEDKQKGPVEQKGMLRSEAFRNPRFWGVCFIAFALSGTTMGIFSQAMALFTDTGFAPAKAAMMISLISFSMAISKILEGWLNDRIGTRINFIIVVIIAIAGMLMLSAVGDSMLAYPAVVMFGVGLASCFVMSPLITVHACGARDFANIYGIVTVFIHLGPVLTPTFSGWTYDVTGSYHMALIIYTALLVAALLIGILVLKKNEYAD